MILNFFKRLNMRKSVEDFTFGFDGNALVDHKIDAIDLSIALAGLDQLLINANQLLNSNHSKLAIKVKPNFEAGSINILTELQQYISDMLPHYSIPQIIEYIGLGAGGVYGVAKAVEKSCSAINSVMELYRKIYPNNRIDKQEETAETVIYELSNGEKITVDKPVAILFSNPNVRKAIAVLLSPLEKDGIDEFYILNSHKNKTQSIKKEETEIFAYRTEEIDLRVTNQVEEERTLFIKKPDFLKKSAWEFVSDGRVIKASIEDEDFLNEVQNGLHLYAGCHFRCKILVSYELNENNIPIDGKTKFTIVKVIDGVKEPLKQLDIFHE